MAQRHGAEVFDLTDDVLDQLRESTEGRGPDSVVEAVGMEAHGSPGAAFAQAAVGILPDRAAKKLMDVAGVDRLAAMRGAFELVRRGGTVSLSGVYGGEPLVEDPADPLGVKDLTTHRVSLDRAPEMYDLFQKKADGCIKVVMTP